MLYDSCVLLYSILATRYTRNIEKKFFFNILYLIDQFAYSACKEKFASRDMYQVDVLDAR